MKTLILLLMFTFTYGSNIAYSNSLATYGGDGQLQARRRIPQNLLDRLKKPNASVSILITVTAGMWLKGPLVHSGRVMKFSAPRGVVVSGVHMNGSEATLIKQSLLATAVSTAGSFYHDTAARLIYVHPPNPTSRSFHDDTYQAKLSFYFARQPKKLRGVFWQPLLLSAPNLSLRIDTKFSGVGQIGGGTLTLANRRGFFDSLDDIQWDAGAVQMEIGIDHADGSSDLDESDYQKVGTWRVEKHRRSKEDFELSLREPKTNLENKIPRHFFTRADYPNIEENKIGTVIPMRYGRLFGRAPIVIDKAARKFKLAVWPIRSIEAVRVKTDSEGWRQVNVESQDLRRAEFTLSASDWANNEQVSVDLQGRTNADGSLMENPADIMADILDYCGETQFGEESFAVTRSWFRVGTDRFGDEVTTLAPCIDIDSQRTGMDVASEINSLAGTFLFVDHAGLWHYGAFMPTRAKDLDPMAGTVIQSFSSRDILLESQEAETDASKVYSHLTVRFAERKVEQWAETVSPELPETQYLHNLAPQFNETKTVALGKKRDAQYWGERFLITEALPLKKIPLSLAWKGFFLLPGDKMKVNNARFSVSSVLEIYECNYNFNNLTVRFLCGDQRGIGDSAGFWGEDVSDSATPPALGLTLWMKPENHIYTEGQQVNIWRDASGNDHHCDGFGLSGPTLRQTSLAANGYAVAHLENEPDANDQSHRFDIPNILGVGSGYTGEGEIFAVVRPDTLAPALGGGALWEFLHLSPSYFPHNAGDIREGFGCQVLVTGISAADIVAGWNLYNVSRTTGNMTVRVNNATPYNADPGGDVAFTATPYIGTWVMSSWAGIAYAEILIYNRVLSAGERATVKQYLSDKYGLALVAAGAAASWNDAWTDTEAAEARANNGFWLKQDADGNETDMASLTDSRSHRPSRWI